MREVCPTVREACPAVRCLPVSLRSHSVSPTVGSKHWTQKCTSSALLNLCYVRGGQKPHSLDMSRRGRTERTQGSEGSPSGGGCLARKQTEDAHSPTSDAGSLPPAASPGGGEPRVGPVRLAHGGQATTGTGTAGVPRFPREQPRFNTRHFCRSGLRRLRGTSLPQTPTSDRTCVSVL